MSVRNSEGVDRVTALAKLSSRGITTLEGLVDAMIKRRRARAFNRKDVDEILERLMAPPDPSLRSAIAPPSPSIPVILDGKRVDASEITRVAGQRLDYVVTTPDR